MGGIPSYVWRSIMEAQVLLKQGDVRRVWMGKMINVMKDPWMPDIDPYIHTTHEALQHQTVDALMVIGQIICDIDLIMDIFEDRDEQLILSIPLRPIDTDSWYWNKYKFGHYMAKSTNATI